MNLTPQQRIERATVSLIRDKDYMWLAGIMVMGTTTISDDPKRTACTDGVNTIYGRDFISRLNDQELMGLVLHENMHKAYMHLTTWRHLYDDDGMLANMACDYVINIGIKDREARDRFVQLPAGGCDDTKYRDMDAGQVFALLKEDKKNGKGNGAGSAQGFDDHDWDSAKSLTTKEVEELTKSVESALRQGNILASKAGGNVDRGIAEMLEPKVDWRTVLREFITNSKRGDDYTSYRRIDRRMMSQSINAPTAYSDHAHRVVIAPDTSGSIRDRELAAFISEAHGICTSIKPDIVDVMYWGHEVAAHEVYEGANVEQMRNSTKPQGGGGTAPSCITSYMRQRTVIPDCVVVITDGQVFGDWGTDWPCPVLWCITTKGITAPNGVTVHLQVD